MEVKASLTKLEDGKRVPDRTVTANVNIPEGLQAKIDLFGEEVVEGAAEDSLIISVQALMRRLMGAGKSDEEVQAAVTEWKPEVRTVIRQSAFEKASGAISKLSAEERAELLKKLQAA